MNNEQLQTLAENETGLEVQMARTVSEVQMDLAYLQDGGIIKHGCLFNLDRMITTWHK